MDQQWPLFLLAEYQMRYFQLDPHHHNQNSRYQNELRDIESFEGFHFLLLLPWCLVFQKYVQKIPMRLIYPDAY